MDEKIIDRERSAVQQNGHVNDQVELIIRFYGFEERQKWEDQHQVIGQKAQQLSERIMPAGSEQSVQKVECIAQKDTTEDHR